MIHYFLNPYFCVGSSPSSHLIWCVTTTVMCPKGDDPVTENQVSRQLQLLVIDGTGVGTFTGHLGVTFQGSTTYLTLGDPSSENCEEVLELNPKFDDVSCNFTANSTTKLWFDITFESWPTFPQENNLFFHDGNPANTDFLCDVSKTDSTVLCQFLDTVNTNLKGMCEVQCSVM